MFPVKKNRVPWWLIAVIVIFVGASGAAGYYGIDYYQKKQTDQGKKANEEPAKTDEYAGWKTYTNNDVGYTLKYPADWTVKEANGVSEITNQQIKYVELASPQQSGLHFGISREAQDWFNLTDRTGIGAGEDMAIAEKAGTLLGATIIPQAHVWENKTEEYFFKTTPQDPGYNFVIWFGVKDELVWPDEAKTWTELDTVNKIFASVAWIDTYTKYDAASAENIAKAEDVAKKYLDARITRDISNAYNYMTNTFQQSMNQEQFAGVSSPSFGSYSNVSGKYVAATKKYSVTATVHWMLQGEESGTSTWTLSVVNESGNFLVNSVEGGYE